VVADAHDTGVFGVRWAHGVEVELTRLLTRRP
jgi:hypothetical protein